MAWSGCKHDLPILPFAPVELGSAGMLPLTLGVPLTRRSNRHRR